MRRHLTLRAALAAAALTLAAGALAQEPAGAVLTLAEALAAVDASPSVAAARDRVELARAELVSWSPISGSLGASASGAAVLAGQGDASASLELSASLAFDLGWDGTSGLEEAEEALSRAEEELVAARSTAVLDVLRRYQSVAAAQRSLRSAELELESAAVSLDAARARFSAGAVTAADVTSAEIAHTSAELDLRAAEGDLSDVLAQLGALLGRDVTAVSEDLPTVPVLPDLSTEERLPLRSDVRSAQRAVVSAEASLAAAQRAANPRLSANASLSGSAGATSFQLGGGIDSSSLEPSLSARLSTGTGASGSAASARASASVGLSVPLGGGGSASVASAETTFSQAVAQLEQTLASAAIEVDGLRRQLDLADERAAVAEALLTQAEAAEAGVTARLDLGLVSRAAVLDAQAARLRAVDQVASAAFEKLSLIVELAAALALDPMEVLL